MAFSLRSVILTPSDLSYSGWVPLLAKAGCNSLILHAANADDIDGLVTWYQGPNGTRLASQCAEFGVALETQLHTASWLLPRSMFTRQPELFRMHLNGVCTGDANFCFNSDAAWEIAAGRELRLQELLPSHTNRYLWFCDDIQHSACHCPVCASLSPSDQALIYANRLSGILRRVNSQAVVSYLAYQDTLACPDQVSPADGVICEFAPIQRCYRHAIDDPGCAVNRDYVLKLKALQGYFSQTPLQITEYWLDASYFSGWKRPTVKVPVSLEVMRRDIAYYEAVGATSLASYAVMCDSEYWQHYGAPPVIEYGQYSQAGN